MCSGKIQENVQKNTLKNLQTENSLDFSGLFLGSRKTEKIGEKIPGGKKKFCKKIPVFLQKKTTGEIYCQKLQKEKILYIFLYFPWLFGPFWQFSSHCLTIFYLSFDYDLTIFHLFF